jgi:hypothetical protein
MAWTVREKLMLKTASFPQLPQYLAHAMPHCLE